MAVIKLATLSDKKLAHDGSLGQGFVETECGSCHPTASAVLS
jgi:hypothetical protein